METHICTSCKRKMSNIARSTLFTCPSCAKAEIVRCGDCREIAAPFVCPSCQFEGPN